MSFLDRFKPRPTIKERLIKVTRDVGRILNDIPQELLPNSTRRAFETAQGILSRLADRVIVPDERR